MPKEMRKIEFSPEELQAALVNYALRTDKKLPNATIDSVSVEGDDAISAKISFVPQGTEEDKTIDFSPNDVAASIILYCNTQGIPLPKESVKSVVKIENSIAMIIKIDFSDLTPGIKTSTANN